MRPVARKAACYLFAVAFILAGWEITSLLVHSPALPTPAATLSVCARYAADLLPDFWISFGRVVLSMAIGTVLAYPLATAFARSRKLDALFAPVLYLLYPIPKIVLLPVLLVLMGLGGAPKIVLIAITIFFQVLVTVRDAAKAVPEQAVLSVRSLGGSRFDVWRHVVLPATLPGLFTSLRVSCGIAVAVLFFAEAIAGSTGLGYFIMQAWAIVNYPKMFSGIIAMAILGVVIYAAFDVCERRVLRWRNAR